MKQLEMNRCLFIWDCFKTCDCCTVFSTVDSPAQRPLSVYPYSSI